jgi:hypothetical protein
MFDREVELYENLRINDLVNIIIHSYTMNVNNSTYELFGIILQQNNAVNTFIL